MTIIIAIILVKMYSVESFLHNHQALCLIKYLPTTSCVFDGYKDPGFIADT